MIKLSPETSARLAGFTVFAADATYQQHKEFTTVHDGMPECFGYDWPDEDEFARRLTEGK